MAHLTNNKWILINTQAFKLRKGGFKDDYHDFVVFTKKKKIWLSLVPDGVFDYFKSLEISPGHGQCLSHTGQPLAAVETAVESCYPSLKIGTQFTKILLNFTITLIVYNFKLGGFWGLSKARNKSEKGPWSIWPLSYGCLMFECATFWSSMQHLIFRLNFSGPGWSFWPL